MTKKRKTPSGSSRAPLAKDDLAAPKSGGIELEESQLDKVSGGATSFTDIHFTQTTNKATP